MKYITIVLLTCSMAFVCVTEAHAQRRGGGGGGNRGGGFHGGGGGGARPQVSRPQVSRPQMNRPTSIPNVNRPNTANMQRPQYSRPANLPSTPSRPAQINRPSMPTAGNRPSTIPNRPGTGMGNNIRPGTSLPGIGNNTRPGGVTRPGTGAGGVTRPGAGDIRPGAGGNRPGIGGGGNRPSPGDLGDFLGMDKPIRPGAGGGGIQRPGAGGDTRPGADGGGIQRPGGGIRPGGDTRPGADGGGIQRPGGDIRPGGDTRPGADGGGIQRPGIRPGDNTRPGAGGSGERWPGGNRPDWANNRPIINKPINIGNQINTNINRRPTWANINNTNITNINRNWNNVVTRPGSPLNNWNGTHPGRVGYWNGWANGVRTGWNMHGYHNNWFGSSWWGAHRFPACGWNYYRALPYYPYNYWWRRPAWTGFATWFTWGAANAAFAQPIYYDYGTGGNVVYQDNSVYIGGQQVATAPEFAESAAALATVEPPANEEVAAKAEWQPLGTFALSTSEKDKEPSRVLQLAVNKDGIISGTLFNYETDDAQGIQGKVDKETQRVAFRMGDKDNIVAETGLYNLTQDEAPLLIHYGKERQENCLLVRLENNEKDGEEKKPANP